MTYGSEATTLHRLKYIANSLKTKKKAQIIASVSEIAKIIQTRF